jgi:hypothetical protein
MPQPLSKVKPDAGFTVGILGARALSRRPQLAVLAAEAIGSWSEVESFMLRLFVRLLGGDAAIAGRIYLALEIQSAKNIAIVEAVNAVPDVKLQNVIRAAIAIAKTRQKARDKLAHHTWGFSDDLPEGLLLIGPKAFVVEGSGIDEIFVYREKDFLDIIEANERLSRYFQQLIWIIGSHPVSADGQLFAQLSSQPEIAERLRRLEERSPTPS